ncbi:MAG: hypothetical protein ACI9WU_004663, partial [Myxococcota bacterium]
MSVDSATMNVTNRFDTLDHPRAVAIDAQDQVHVTHLHAPVLRGIGGSEYVNDLRTANPVDLALEHNQVGVVGWRAMSATVSPGGNVLVAHVLSRPGQTAPSSEVGTVTETEEVTSGGGYGGTASSQTIITTKRLTPPDLLRPIELAVTRVGMPHTNGAQPVVNRSNATMPTALVDQPSDINHSPTHALALAVGRGSDNVLALDTSSGDPMESPVGLFEVGQAPKAVVFSADGMTAWVLNDDAYSISVLDLSPVLGDALPAHVPRSASKEVAFAVDPLPTELRAGRRVFNNAHNWRVSTRGRFACATCHPEGTEDKLTWILPDGPRQTPSLTGRLEAT